MSKPISISAPASAANAGPSGGGIELFSTMLYRQGEIYLLDEHIARLRRSLARLQLDYAVPAAADVMAAIESTPCYQNARASGDTSPTCRCRMVVGPTGITYEAFAFTPSTEDTSLTNEQLMLGPLLQTPPRSAPPEEIVQSRKHWTIVLDTRAIDTAGDDAKAGMTTLALLQNKTTCRAAYEAAARRMHADVTRRQEVLLYDGDGLVTEGTITSVALWRGGRWMVAPIDIGCLDGVVRRHLLDRALVHEATADGLHLMHKSTVRAGEWCLVFNALRGVNWARVVSELDP